jgi:Uma2 family endonuclease
MEPPPALWHRGCQRAIARLLERYLGPCAIFEPAVHTAEGTRIPDVAWARPRFWKARAGRKGARLAPPICVEVMSPSNTASEMAMKRRLYLASGAEEVWTCEPDGTMHYTTAGGERHTSARVPNAPARLDADSLFT